MDLPDARWFIANLAQIRLSGLETGGRLGIVELLGAPGDMPPLHVHRVEDEIFVILEGRLTVHQPGRAVDAPAGSLVHARRDVPHTYRVSDEGPARWLAVSAPAGFEQFVEAASEPARALTLPVLDREPDPEKLASLATRFGIELMGPPGTLP